MCVAGPKTHIVDELRNLARKPDRPRPQLNTQRGAVNSLNWQTLMVAPDRRVLQRGETDCPKLRVAVNVASFSWLLALVWVHVSCATVQGSCSAIIQIRRPDCAPNTQADKIQANGARRTRRRAVVCVWQRMPRPVPWTSTRFKLSWSAFECKRQQTDGPGQSCLIRIEFGVQGRRQSRLTGRANKSGDDTLAESRRFRSSILVWRIL